MQTETVRGLSIAYQRAGEGPPLVLLHGILGDSRDWRPQIDDLSDNLDVIAWDAPGCGQSADPPEEGFEAADFADCLAEFIREVTASPVHLAGISWGGALALEFYRRHPDTTTSLILADTYAGWKGSLPEKVVAERLASCLQESEMPPEEFVPGWIRGLVTDGAPLELRDELATTMSEFHPVGYRVMIRAFADLDLRPVLPTISVPTLLLWGEDDRRSPLSAAETISDAIAGARLVVVPDAGHVSNMEQPERFNAEVRAFCLAVDAAGR